jgi:hypothetical protein
MTVRTFVDSNILILIYAHTTPASVSRMHLNNWWNSGLRARDY